MEKIVTFVEQTLHSQIFLLTLTIGVYYAAQLLYGRFKLMIFNPIIVSSLLIIAFLHIAHIDYVEYLEANAIINFLLGVSVVPLSYLMHKNVNRIREQRASIILSTLLGSLVGVFSIIGFAHIMGFEEVISLSLQPKSVTTPIALSVSRSIGGIPPITALSVVIAGIFGNVAGGAIMKLCRITDPVARGLALGSASHAVGTARAIEMGATEGAVGGAAIGLMGLFTAIVLPIINALM